MSSRKVNVKEDCFKVMSQKETNTNTKSKTKQPNSFFVDEVGSLE